ncbi:hypothetical protein [Cohnella abietis]|nr:hypothetical protein [Cohnella abietis]
MNQCIRSFIEDNKLTFTLVSDRSGINMKKFSRMMTGKQKISTDDYETICLKGLNISPAFFYAKKFLETKNTA